MNETLISQFIQLNRIILAAEVSKVQNFIFANNTDLDLQNYSFFRIELLVDGFAHCLFIHINQL